MLIPQHQSVSHIGADTSIGDQYPKLLSDINANTGVECSFVLVKNIPIQRYQYQLYMHVNLHQAKWYRERVFLLSIPDFTLFSSTSLDCGSLLCAGIQAEVMVVRSFEELKLRGSEAVGKVVVFNQPFVSYGETVAYRAYGASEAAKLGAVATLIRSITPFSINR